MIKAVLLACFYWWCLITIVTCFIWLLQSDKQKEDILESYWKEKCGSFGELAMWVMTLPFFLCLKLWGIKLPWRK